MKLYMARHGQTDWNLAKRIQGDTDVPLNETGIQQARDLQGLVREIEFDACYASPLARALKTAEIATEGKYEIILDDRLRERRFGELEGKPMGNWLDLTNGIDIFDRKLDFAGMGIEPPSAVMSRAKSFLDNLKAKYSDDEAVLVVAHAGILKVLHFNIVGYNDETNFVDFKIKNGELKEYEI